MRAPRQIYEGFLPGRVPIDAYGDGGFRFGDMSHRGSLMALPSGMHRWNVGAFSDLDASSFALALAEVEAIEFLLLGTGPELRRLAPEIDRKLREGGLRTEPMSTGAAARTYNVLLAEGRLIAAALIAVE